MKVIAKAIPNKKYENIRSLWDMVLEARLENNRIKYFETHTSKPDWVVELKESTVISLFYVEDPQVRNVPFLREENIDFFHVLHRDHFRNAYIKLKNAK